MESNIKSKKRIPRRQFLKWASFLATPFFTSWNLLQFLFPSKAKAGGFIPFSFVKKNVSNSDPYYSNVSLLINGDGIANAQQNNTFIDSSSNNVNITRYGDVTQGSFSPFGKSWSQFFDGSGDYLSLTNGPAFKPGASSAFSLELWFYPTTQTGVNTALIGNYKVISYPSSSTGFDILFNTTNNLAFRWGYPNYADSGNSPAVVLSTWNHVVVSRNSSSTLSCYLNGTRWFTTSSNTGITDSGESTFWIGWAGSISGTVINPFAGYISNVRMVVGSTPYDPTLSSLTVPRSPLTVISGTTLLTCQSNRFVDLSSNNLTITPVGDTKVVKHSPFTEVYDKTIHGGSAIFDGNGDYLTIPANTWNFGSSNFTVEAWVYQQITAATVQVIGAHNNGTDCSWLLSFNSTSITFSWNTSLYVTISATIPLNSWSHIAAVRDSNTIRLYINGAQVGSGALTGNINSDSRLISIGADFDGNGSVYTGFYSNIRVVNGTALYNANFTIPTAPLTALSGTSFLMKNENSGIVDLTGKNNLLTIGNAQISTAVSKFGSGSLYFDGTTYMTLQATDDFAFGSNDFTIELWANLLSEGKGSLTATGFIGQWKSQATMNMSWFFNYYNNNLVLCYTTNGSSQINIMVAYTISYSTWYHLAVVRKGSSVYFFVNGQQVGTTQSISGAINPNSTNVFIGAQNNLPIAADYRINGYIDDLRVTKGIARYTANFTPPTASLPVK